MLQLLEDLLKLKYNGEVSDEWDLTKVKNKEEMIITNTYVNTRIYPIDEAQNDIDQKSFRNQIETNMPKNNRNAATKSNTFNSTGKEESKQTPGTRLIWKDQAGVNKSLTEVIVNKIDKIKRIADIPKVISHRQDTVPRPIITSKLPAYVPRPQMGNLTTTSKGKFKLSHQVLDINEPLIFNMHAKVKKVNESLEYVPSAKFRDPELEIKGNFL